MSELSKTVQVRVIKRSLGLEQLTGDEASLDRLILAPDINRPGLELSGFDDENELQRVMVIGHKEQKYLRQIDYDVQLTRFDFLMSSHTPCIIISGADEPPRALIEVATRKNFPVFRYPEETYRLTVDLTAVLTQKLAPVDFVHGCMMNIYGVGVLIMGASGIGKSELCLDLIKRGHIFVGDDLIEVAKIGKALLCEAPDNIKRMLEVRGIGIIDVNVIFGGHCFLNKCPLDFVIKLVKLEDYYKSNPERLNPLENKLNILDIKKPILEIPVTEGKSMSVIVETAVTNYIMKKQGINSNDIFKQRIIDEIMAK